MYSAQKITEQLNIIYVYKLKYCERKKVKRSKDSLGVEVLCTKDNKYAIYKKDARTQCTKDTKDTKDGME